MKSPGADSTVHLVWHVSPPLSELDDTTRATLIGCFSSRQRAEDERASAARLPLFEQGDVWIETWELNRPDENWMTGFFTWR